ncbi:MAG: tetratricopeptide repeat protein [Desulfovibrionaceae bacterium]
MNKIFALLVTFLFLYSQSFLENVYANSFRWKNLFSSEELLFTLNNPKNLQIKRIGKTELLVSGPKTYLDLVVKSQTEIIRSTFISSIKARQNTLVITLQDSNFGYIVSRQRDSVTLILFPDTMGQYWSFNTQDTNTIQIPTPTPHSLTQQIAILNTPLLQPKQSPQYLQAKAIIPQQNRIKEQLVSIISPISGNAQISTIPIQKESSQQNILTTSFRHSINTGSLEDWNSQNANTQDNPISPKEKEEDSAPIAEKEKDSSPSQKKTVSDKKSSPSLPLFPSEKPVNQNTLVTIPDEQPTQERYEKDLAKALQFLSAGKIEEALSLLLTLKNTQMPPAIKEEILYFIADSYEALSRTQPALIQKSIAAYNEAMNFNPHSTKTPDALLKLAMVNLTLKNTKEAEAYFSAVQKRFPKHTSTPFTYYYLGMYYKENKEYAKALEQFQIIEKNYPTFTFLRENTVAIIETLVAMGYYKEAIPYTDFLNTRWPSFYQEYPKILLFEAQLATHLKDYTKALSLYWKYYNILPDAPEIDLVMANIADTYLRQKQTAKATILYNKIIKDFPQSEGALISQMRLAEEGIYDTSADLNTMFSIFDRPYNTRPLETYTKIKNEHPDSPLAPIAHAKLAIWYLWEGDNSRAIESVHDFVQKYPDSPLVPSLNDIAIKALETITLDEKTQKELPDLWDKYPVLFSQNQENISPKEKLSLAKAFHKNGDFTKTQELLQEFFKGRQYPGLSEEVLSLQLTLLNETKNWNTLIDTYYRTISWDLSQQSSSMLAFYAATAFEKTNQQDKAFALWEKLFNNVFTPPYYKGIAAYSMAQMLFAQRKAPQFIYPIAQNSLNSLLLAVKNNEISLEESKTNIIDALALLVSIAKEQATYQDALRYIILQESYDPEDKSLLLQKAELFKLAGDTTKWKETLEAVVKKEGTSSYGQLAQSELNSEKARQEIKTLIP